MRSHVVVGHALLALLIAPLLALSSADTAAAQTRTFRIAAGGGSRIQFVSDAPLERITGVSDRLSGELTVDPSAVGGARGRVSVPVNSLRTGLDLRDEHLHGSGWLDAASHPEASFEITAIEGATALVPNQVVRMTIRGRFSIHGVTREISASAQVRYVPASDELRAQGVTGDLIRAQASFTVQLPDFNVSVNPVVRLKVSDTIRVNVTLRAISS